PHVRLSLDDASAESIATYRFATKEVFRVVAAGCYSDEMPEQPEPAKEEPAEKSEDSEQASEESGQSEEKPEEAAEPAAPETPDRHEPPPFRARALAHVPGMLPLT